LSSCFLREFQSATLTVAGTSFSFLPAVLAYGREFLGNSRDASAVNVLVACLANSNTVRYIVSKVWMIAPGFFVVGLKVVSCAALLAGVVISIVDGIAPLSVFAGVALLVCVWLALGSIPTFLTAIFDFQMTAWVTKLFPAVLAGQELSSSRFARLLAGTTAGAGNSIEVYPSLEGLTANDAYPLVAIGAVITSWIMDSERLPALFTRSLKRECLSVHNRNYNIFPLQRWADMTGGEPRLLD
jgi:hypothetical protein